MSRRTTTSDYHQYPHAVLASQQDDDEDGRRAMSNAHVEAGSNNHQQLLCLILHCGLVAIHIILAVTYAHHLEHSVAFDINSFSTNWFPFIVTAISQAVGAAYLAALVLLTQRLALRGYLYTSQTLTAIHDKSIAWLGLGSAFASLWQQFKLPAAIPGVVIITSYLLATFTLHITIPGLFQVIPFNATVLSSHPTVLANGPISENSSLSYDILTAYNSDQLIKLGLHDNMVYDVIPVVPFASGQTVVNASIFDVQCESILPSSPTVITTGIVQDVAWSVNYHPLNANLPWFTSQLPIYPSVMAGVYYPSNNDSCIADTSVPCWLPFILSSTLPVVDASGEMGNDSSTYWTSVWPQVLQATTTADNQQVIVQGNQLLQCAVQINDVKINVSAENQQPVSPPSPGTASAWSDQSWPYRQTIHDARLSMALTIPETSPPTMRQPYADMEWFVLNASVPSSAVSSPTVSRDDPNYSGPDIELGDASINPGAFDVFLMEELGVVPLGNNKTNIALADLNFSLGKAIAAVYWYSNSLNFTNPYSGQDGLLYNITQFATNPPSTRRGEAIIAVSVTRVRLNLSLIPVVVGLVASVLLLVLSVILTRVHSSSLRSVDTRAAVDYAGVLQLTWILGNEPHMRHVREPSSQMLREAGMFEVKMSDRMQDKMYEAVEKDEETNHDSDEGSV